MSQNYENDAELLSMWGECVTGLILQWSTEEKRYVYGVWSGQWPEPVPDQR